ncbi:MAG: glycosyltransferase family 4 protein, partial [Phycisphaerae bacterium]|nr:glycosyltransferase family 4 protein [Phycisphaerae bacterium]
MRGEFGKMKIAFIIERFEPLRGGRERSTYQIAAELARRGHGVKVFCQTGQGAEGIDVQPLGTSGVLRSGRLKRFVSSVQSVLALDSFDIVHAMLPISGANVYQPRGGTVPGQATASLRRRGLLGRLAVATTGPLNICRKTMGEYERAVVGDPNVLCLAVSQMVAEEFRNYYGRTDGVRVVYNAVQVPDVAPAARAEWRQRLRSEIGAAPDDPVFITVASNFRLKGVAETIRAFARWQESRRGDIHARLLVVGREKPESYERCAAMRNVGAQVVFVPPTDDIFQWYAAADACILLSWYDPCSRVVLEATRWGIPSVTTVFNGAAEVLAEGAGIVVGSPKDIRAVMAAVDELSDAHRRAVRTDACLRVAAKLSIERHVDELLT